MVVRNDLGPGGVLDSRKTLRIVLGLMVVVTLGIGLYINTVAMKRYTATPVAGGNNIGVRGSTSTSGSGSSSEATNDPVPLAPTPVPTTAAPATIDTAVLAEVEKHRWAKAVWKAVKLARDFPESADLIPVVVIPLFHDGVEMEGLLESFDCPVRLFSFAWNSDSSDVRQRIELLMKLPYGVMLAHHPDNVGFSGAVNRAIYNGEKYSKMHQHKLEDDWYFIINADAAFPHGNLGRFAREVNKAKLTHGLFYGPRQDHFAFVITRLAIETVGYMDEVFFPGYMEDIDYRWRVRIANLPQVITRIEFIHRSGGSSTLRKNLPEFKAMLHRSSQGWEYGWQKWGKYNSGHIEHDHPPSGWKTPFNIPGASLKLWAIDEGQRNCVRTGQGHYHVASSTCWYNGTVLLKHLPEGTVLTDNLLRPGPSGG